MKNARQIVLSGVVSAAMVLSLSPATALADDSLQDVNSITQSTSSDEERGGG